MHWSNFAIVLVRWFDLSGSVAHKTLAADLSRCPLTGAHWAHPSCGQSHTLNIAASLPPSEIGTNRGYMEWMSQCIPIVFNHQLKDCKAKPLCCSSCEEDELKIIEINWLHFEDMHFDVCANDCQWDVGMKHQSNVKHLFFHVFLLSPNTPTKVWPMVRCPWWLSNKNSSGFEIVTVL